MKSIEYKTIIQLALYGNILTVQIKVLAYLIIYKSWTYILETLQNTNMSVWLLFLSKLFFHMFNLNSILI